ncbi:hypothetical protein PF008_g31719, partial [Phytophthora fragariae]
MGDLVVHAKTLEVPAPTPSHKARDLVRLTYISGKCTCLALAGTTKTSAYNNLARFSTRPAATECEEGAFVGTD